MINKSLAYMNRWVQRNLGLMVLVVISLILYFFLLLPVSKLIVKAFIGPDGFTLDFFKLLFTNHLHKAAILNSLNIGLWTTILATLVSLPLAIINVRYEFFGKTFLTGLLLVPMVMPPFVGAIGIQRFFARFGAVNIFLLEHKIIDTPIEWLSDSNMFWAVVLLEVLHLYPIMYLNLSAAIANLDPSLEDMADTLGVGKFRQFKDIIWPLANPGFFAGAIIVFIWALTDLGTPLLVGFHETMPVFIFNMVSDINENPVGYALVFVVVLITVCFFLLSKYLLGRKKYEMLARGHTVSRVRAAGWKLTVFFYVLLSFVIFFALIPHMTVLVTSVGENWFMTPLPENYTLKYYSAVFTQSLSSIGIKNSFLFALISTFVDLILGVIVAYIVVRKKNAFSTALDILVMIPLALPGIVLAFGYVVTYSNTFLDPLHNSVPLLIIAYSIRRLPYMVRSASAGLQQTSVSLEEASETLGASRFHTLRKITIPLVFANLIAGGLLCFSYAMLDVSDSLILAMKDQFYPITKVIYALYLEQGSGEFVASALGIVAMVILTFCIMGSSLILGKKMGELFRS